MNLLRSSCVCHRARLGAADKCVYVRQAMPNIVERNYRCYGYQRLHALLSNQCANVSEEVVRLLTKQECLVASTSKRR